MQHLTLFNIIAPVYALFYKYQHKHYSRILQHLDTLALSSDAKVLDLACGTGGLTGVLAKRFKHVVGLDGSQNMLDEAIKLHRHQNVDFLYADLREKLPYEDQSMDLITTAFFLHGITRKDREFVLSEMVRVAKYVLIFDYYGKSNIIISTVEWLEHGDYFNFRKTFMDEWKACCKNSKIIPITSMNAIYINF